MSSFDKRVCLWLSDAALSNKAKVTTLNRINTGINNYRNLGLEPTAFAGHTEATLAVRVDYKLQDSIAKAVHRLRESSSTDATPRDLFPQITRESMLQRTPRETPRSSRPTTPRTGALALQAAL